MSKATVDDLGELHSELARVAKSQLQVDEPSAAWGSVALAFLKHNNITADPETNAGLKELSETLKSRRKTRRITTEDIAAVAAEVAADMRLQ